MRRIGLFGLIILVVTGMSVWAEQPDAFKEFFDRLSSGAIFLEQPSSSEGCQPVDYFQLVPGTVAPVDFQLLPLSVQDNIGEISAEKLYVFQVKNTWTNEVRKLYVGVEKGRSDGGITAFDESRTYNPCGSLNPKPSLCFGDYIITKEKSSMNLPVEILAYELKVEKDDKLETTDVKADLLVRNNTSQMVAAVGGEIYPLSKLDTPLTADKMRFEIQDEILLAPGRPSRIKINLKLPAATRKITPVITSLLYDDGSLWRASN
ncbi:MAG TPA: hypothetical protein VHR47_11050 [Bacillota bacterium]|nr:hypothetical protein [Bacillota bacterium]